MAGLPVATQALQRVRQAAARVFAVTDAAGRRSPNPTRRLPLPDGPYHLEIRSLWAGYPGAAAPALRGLDLVLPPGRRVAIVGPSGAGKSTLAAVLLRFPAARGRFGPPERHAARSPGRRRPPHRGRHGGPGRAISSTPPSPKTCVWVAARRHRRELRQVLARVGLGGWLDELPRGLATEVGRHGARLSGGQRQRIAVARALLADFPVLVLDEPAEHLDPVTADALTADLLTITEGRSLLLITHRLAGLESVDEIVVMEAGRVVERGTHDELLAEGRRYSNLWWEEMRTERFAVSQPIRPTGSTDATDRHHHPRTTGASPHEHRSGPLAVRHHVASTTSCSCRSPSDWPFWWPFSRPAGTGTTTPHSSGSPSSSGLFY